MMKKNSLVDCWFFQNKTCIKGDTCPFVHDSSHAATPVTSSSKAVCKFWRREGQCGDLSCKFLHSEPVVKKLVCLRRVTTVCRFFSQGNCGKGDVCPFQHVVPKNGDRIASNGISGALMVGRTSRHAEPFESGAVVGRSSLSASSSPQTPPPPDEDESTTRHATTVASVLKVSGQKHKLVDSTVNNGNGQSATDVVAAELLKRRRKLVRVSHPPTGGVSSAAVAAVANSSRILGSLGPVLTSHHGKPEAPKTSSQSTMKERYITIAPPIHFASRLVSLKQGSAVGAAGVQKPVLKVGDSKAADKSLDFEEVNSFDILKKRVQQGAAVSQREEPVRAPATVVSERRVGLRRGGQQVKEPGGVGTGAVKKDKPLQHAATVVSTLPKNKVKPNASRLDFEVPSFEDIMRKKKIEMQRTVAVTTTTKAISVSRPSAAAPAPAKLAVVVSASQGVPGVSSVAPGPKGTPAVNCTSGSVVVLVAGAVDPLVKHTAVVSKIAHLNDELAEFEAMLEG